MASLRAFHYLIPTWLLHLTSSSSSCQISSRNTLKHRSYQSCRYFQRFEQLFLYFPDYLSSWGLQNTSFREEKFTATYGSRTRRRVGFNRSSHQSDREHGGLGAPAPLNPPCSLQEQLGVLGILGSFILVFILVPFPFTNTSISTFYSILVYYRGTPSRSPFLDYATPHLVEHFWLKKGHFTWPPEGFKSRSSQDQVKIKSR